LSEFDPRIDYYAALGVGSTASGDDILKAYHALAAKYHPDKHQGNDLEDLAREKLTEINAAFAVVGNPSLRARYDAARRSGRASYTPGGGGAASDGGRPRAEVSSTLRTVLIVIAVLVALPLVLRFLRNPRLLLIIAAVLAALWLGPKIVRYFRR